MTRVIQKQKGPDRSKPKLTDDKIRELLETKSVRWICKNYFVGTDRVKKVERGQIKTVNGIPVSDRQDEILKLLDLVEWQCTSDIAQWVGVRADSANQTLCILRGKGLVERKFDSVLGRRYWRLAGGEQFHKASKEMKR